jgi:hypothetical protein
MPARLVAFTVLCKTRLRSECLSGMGSGGQLGRAWAALWAAVVAGLILVVFVPASSGGAAPIGAASVSRRDLDSAIVLFARFNPQLLEPNRRTRLAGRQVAPSFSPLVFSGEPSIQELGTHLIGTLAGGELGELDMFLEDGAGTTTFQVPHHDALSDSSAYDLEALVNSVAFIEGAVEPHTDVLVRPIPLGFSVYVQFRSVSTPERFSIEDKVFCAPSGFELIRRVRPGTFSLEEVLGEREAECEPYSRSLVAPVERIEPSDTAANYAHERRLIMLARKQARRDHASLLDVVSASPARDATGRLVPTEMAWRYEETPVLRVHLRAGHYRYPVLARVDFFVGDR